MTGKAKSRKAVKKEHKHGRGPTTQDSDASLSILDPALHLRCSQAWLLRQNQWDFFLHLIT